MKDRRMKNPHGFTPQEAHTLLLFIFRTGRFWKRDLFECWNGIQPWRMGPWSDRLRALRDRFGMRWLGRVKRANIPATIELEEGRGLSRFIFAAHRMAEHDHKDSITPKGWVRGKP